MDFFGLRDKEQPFIIRLAIALIVSVAAVIVLVAMATLMFHRYNLDYAALLFMWVSIALLLVVRLKITDLSLYMLGCVPLIAILLWINYKYYAGVINLWPARIILVTWVLAIYFGKRARFKLAIYSVMTVILALTGFFSLPSYTRAQARDAMAAELNVNVDQLGPGLGSISAISNYHPHNPSIFISGYYLFDAEVNGTVSTYFFNPKNGRVEELQTWPLQKDSMINLPIEPSQWPEKGDELD